MNSTNPTVTRTTLFSVRATFVVACVALLVVLFLPAAIMGKHAVQRTVLVLAAVAVLSGWYFLVKYRERCSPWRTVITLVTSVYLTASIPVFLFELSQVRWLMHHRMLSLYTRLWVHQGSQGYLLVFAGVVGSFMGSGRSRIAFILGSILLMILRASMGTWVS